MEERITDGKQNANVGPEYPGPEERELFNKVLKTS